MTGLLGVCRRTPWVHDRLDSKVVPNRFQPRRRSSVIVVDYETLRERPMVWVVLREGADATPVELETHFAKSVPD